MCYTLCTFIKDFYLQINEENVAKKILKHLKLILAQERSIYFNDQERKENCRGYYLLHLLTKRRTNYVTPYNFIERDGKESFLYNIDSQKITYSVFMV